MENGPRQVDYGAMRDTLESMGADAGTLASEIAKYPNFEHLEAEERVEEDGEEI